MAFVPNPKYAKKVVDTAPSPFQKKFQASLPQPPQPPADTISSRASNDIQTAGKNVNEAISGTGQYQGQGVIRRATGAVSEAASAPLKVASEVLPKPVRAGIGEVGKIAGDIVGWLGDKIGSTQLAQDFVTKHPEAAKTLEEIAGTSANLGNTAGNILMADAGVKIGSSISKDVGSLASKAKTTVTGTEPSISVGGKTITLDQIHSAEGTKIMKGLTPGEQRLISKFDQEQSLTKNIETAKASGKSTADLEAMQSQMANKKIGSIDEQLAALQNNPESLTLYRGEGKTNVGGTSFTTDKAWTDTFGGKKLEGQLPAGSKIKVLTAKEVQEAMKKGLTSSKEMNQDLFDQGYAGVARLDQGRLQVDVNPKLMDNFASAETTAGSKGMFGSESKVPATPKELQSSIDAVNPNLSGKKLTGAYKQTVSGGRDVTPASIFKEQGLTPDQQAINLGTRLQDLKLGRDPIKNIDKLGAALEEAESKLTTALKGDPEINYHANKPDLISSLDKAKGTIPREFSTIKDSKATFNNVMDFAKQTVAKADDSISGLRDARTAFDTQAHLEYPNAFKEGGIDVKTPAGRAIKQARDLINEHLYNTAPNGSEIQGLIGREADIFRATDTIAPKAALGHGKNSFQLMIEKHPTLSRYIKYAVGGYITDKALKATTGVGF